MTIKDLYEVVGDLPKQINVINSKEEHIWIGDYGKAPEEIKMLGIKKAFLKNWGDTNQVVIYI